MTKRTCAPPPARFVRRFGRAAPARQSIPYRSVAAARIAARAIAAGKRTATVVSCESDLGRPRGASRGWQLRLATLNHPCFVRPSLGPLFYIMQAAFGRGDSIALSARSNPRHASQCKTCGNESII